MLTEEQVEDIRDQLLEQAASFPEDKREAVKEKILSMTPEEIEEFLKQNQSMSQEGQGEQKHGNQQCIFCSIIEGKISSYKIVEEKEEIAVLEINPIAKGHILILPKKHLETTKIPKSSFSLAKKIAERVKEKLKPEEIKISTNKILGHGLIEVIPLYKGTNPNQRKKAEEKELLEVQNLLKIIKKEVKPRAKKSKEEKTEQTKSEAKINLPKVKSRIP